MNTLDNINGEIFKNISLADFTWYKIGGKADILIYPKNIEDIQKIIEYSKQKNLPYFVIGDGANLLVHDNGYRGIVISLQQYFSSIDRRKNYLRVGSGTKMSDLIKYCENEGLKGFEQLSGIPGTVGGLLRMNAGTDNGLISDFLISVHGLDNDGEEFVLRKESIAFGYRSAPQLSDKIILEGEFQLQESSSEELRDIRCNLINTRFKKQPLQYPSCGSVFKRPEGNFAGRLIEASGLKGCRIGNAEVSSKHAGFIINRGNATSKDVFALMKKIRDEVNNQFGILLEPEVKFLGFSDVELSKIGK